MSLEPPRSSPVALIALGANLGDPIPTLDAAIERLRAFAESGFARSSIWRSSPVDCPPGSPVFFNAAVRFCPKPDESPESLLRALLAMETEWGVRDRSRANAPRYIDLDLIAFGAERRDTAELLLPHPRAIDRKFVLAPLEEIAGSLCPFEDSRDIATLLRDLEDSDQRIERL